MNRRELCIPDDATHDHHFLVGWQYETDDDGDRWATIYTYGVCSVPGCTFATEDSVDKDTERAMINARFAAEMISEHAKRGR